MAAADKEVTQLGAFSDHHQNLWASVVAPAVQSWELVLQVDETQTQAAQVQLHEELELEALVQEASQVHA